jgi:hypothetical protein
MVDATEVAELRDDIKDIHSELSLIKHDVKHTQQQLVDYAENHIGADLGALKDGQKKLLGMFKQYEHQAGPSPSPNKGNKPSNK